MECGCLHGGVIENGRAHNPLTLCSVPALVHVQVWGCTYWVTLGVQLRNATTTKYRSVMFKSLCICFGYVMFLMSSLVVDSCSFVFCVCLQKHLRLPQDGLCISLHYLLFFILKYY